MIKILYAVQGTGNGHVCRAQDIIPLLQKKGEVDILISGVQSDVQLPFPVKYVFRGLSFIFGKKGGIDLLETYKKAHLKTLLEEIKSLRVEQYDIVISDFEPVSAWACYIKNKPCIALSHQAAVMNKKSPKPKKTDPVGKAIMKVYAPTSVDYGFHFKSYSDNIYTPVIRQQIREAAAGNKGHYTVYLPAYEERRIIKILSECEGIKWEVFSKHFKKRLSVKNVEVFPIDSDEFVRSMVSAEGVLCGAGFETPAEALYLHKKLLVIPMKNQFEQHCNAAALKEMGVPVMKSLKLKHLEVLKNWVASSEKVLVDYPDISEQIISQILEKHTSGVKEDTASGELTLNQEKISAKKLRNLTLKQILSRLAN